MDPLSNVGIVVPEGWGFAPESNWLDFAESQSFAAELVPQAIRATAKPGTSYRNPATGVTLQKQPSGRWRKIGTGDKPPTPTTPKPPALPENIAGTKEPSTTPKPAKPTAPKPSAPSANSPETEAPPTSYPERKSNAITIGFGRFNPPTIGHQKLIEQISKTAQESGSDYNVFGSHSQDPKKNPLSSGAKTSYMKEMFPEQADNIVYDPKVRTLLDALESAHKRGYKEANIVVGSDRLEEFTKLANKYNGEGQKYNFDKINVISAGDRDEDGGGDEVSSMSASKLRKLASDGDFNAFAKGIPNTLPTERKQSLYDELRGQMGVKG